MREKSNPFTRTLARAYELGTKARKLIYDSGLIELVRVERPVISVGNIVAGGAGKTPLTIMLVERLQARGLKVCVLSRGYGAETPPTDRPRIVCDGNDVLVDVKKSGDEPQMIAKRTSACVVVYPDRVEAARLAIEALEPDVFVMDDGFQHWRLARDLNILIMDAREPLGNGELLPAGPLREPAEAIEKAHLIAINHGSELTDEVHDQFEEWGPNFQVHLSPTGLRPFGEQTLQACDSLANKKVALVSAIARSERFKTTVENLGAEVVLHHAYRDHYNISPGELTADIRKAQSLGAEMILVTEKHGARIHRLGEWKLPIFVLCMNLTIHEGEERLEAALDRLLGNASK